MDLSFRFADADARPLPAIDLAPLIAALGERQAASATARIQAAIGEAGALPPPPLAPPHGAFNAAMAARLAAWSVPASVPEPAGGEE